MESVRYLANVSAVVIFSRSTCCMCHSVKRLFADLGVTAVVHEIDQLQNGGEVERALARLLLLQSNYSPVPAVFIGGRLVGSTDRVMTMHMEGKLVSMLRAAGAIWL